MRLLFLMLDLPDLGSGNGGFYADLIKEMSSKGHKVFAICNNSVNKPNGLYKEGDVTVVRLKVPFLKTNTSLLRKGLGSIMMNPCYKYAIREYLKNEKFDYVFLPTPPATLINVAKKLISISKNKTKLYVILRDIQPECADRKVSHEIANRTDVYEECKKPFGINPVAKWLLYRKSQQLYKAASMIGCMSPGNIDFVKSIAPYVKDNSLKLLPNWYAENNQVPVAVSEIRKKYNLEGKFVAIFGGNIGPQQAVWNIAQLAKMNIDKKDVVFLVVGKGVKKYVLEEMAQTDHLTNILFMNFMPKEDYEAILQTADLGIISLDEKYKVPTCPSKIIGYMAMAKPVLAMFNKGSDYGDFYIDKPACGLWSVDLDNKKMQENFEWFYTHPEERKQMGLSGYNYFKKYLSVEAVADTLDNQLKGLQ